MYSTKTYPILYIFMFTLDYDMSRFESLVYSTKTYPILVLPVSLALYLADLNKVRSKYKSGIWQKLRSAAMPIMNFKEFSATIQVSQSEKKTNYEKINYLSLKKIIIFDTNNFFYKNICNKGSFHNLYNLPIIYW